MRALVLGSKEFPLGSSDGSDKPSGGMESYVDGLARALSAKGLELVVVTRKFKHAHATEEIRGVDVVRVPFIRGFYFRNPSFNLAAFFRSIALEFDIIISNGEVSNFLGLLLSKLKRKPIIMVSHGLASAQPQYNRAIRLAFRIGDNVSYGHADAVVTHAPWQMGGYGFHTIMPGLDTSRLGKLGKSEAAKFKSIYAERDEKVIVYTGRLIGVKGLDCLIRSLKFVKGRHVLLLVGDGPDREKLESLARGEGANAAFIGFRKDVARFLSIADAFVLPSLSESLNYSLVEAAYMGVPIVCTDIGIISSDAAELAKPGDEKSLASSLNNVLSSPSKAKVRNAMAYAKTFDWGNAAGEYMKLIRSLVKE